MKTSIILLLALLFIGMIIFYEVIPKNECENICEEKGTPFYKVIKSGSLKLDDLCVCYLENKIETERMG